MKILIIPGLLGHPEEKTFQDLSVTLEGLGHKVIKVAWPYFPNDLTKYSMTETVNHVRNIVKDFSEEKWALLGFSMGGVIATEVAAEIQPSKLGLIVSPYQAGTADDLEGKYKEWKETGYRELTSSVYGKLKIPFSFIEDAQKYNILNKIGSITCSKIIIAGEMDTKVPYSVTKKIYDKAVEPKEWHLIPQMEHRYQYQASEFLQKVNELIVNFIEK